MKPKMAGKRAENDDGGGEDSEKKNLLVQTQDIMKKFAKQSSAHGLPRLARSQSNTGRVFWAATCVCALGMFTTQGVILLKRYYSYPKSVRLDISNEAVPFPAVSICNLRSLDLYSVGDIVYNQEGSTRWDFGHDFLYSGRSNATNPVFEANVIQYVNNKQSYHALAEILETELNQTHYAWEAEKQMLTRMTVASNMNASSATQGGIKAEEFIAFCEYAGEHCSYMNFTQFLDPAYFNCYTFDLGTALEQASVYEGPDHGLTLVLFVPSIGIMGYSSENKARLAVNQELTIGGEGVRVVIHRPNTIPFPLTDGINAPRGTAVSLGVNLVQQERLGEPHGNCTDRTNLGGIFNYTYTMTSCKKMCLQTLVKETCGCCDPSLPLPNTDDFSMCAAFDALPPYCLGREQLAQNLELCRPLMMLWFDRIKCMRSTRSNVSKNLSAWQSCSCAPSCRENQYDYEFSMADWPMEEQSRDLVQEILYSQQFINNFPADKADKYFGSVYYRNHTFPPFEAYEEFVKDKNFLRLSVYVADTSVLKVVEIEAYSLTQLASDVGGQLSLWVGVSIITLVEMVELIMSVCHYCADRANTLRKRGNKVVKSEKTATVNVIQVKEFGSTEKFALSSPDFKEYNV